MKQTTLGFSLIDGKVLLAMKKRGFGVGRWNGPGGKLEPGETALEACIRETREEVGIELVQPEHRGTIEFIFEGKDEWSNQCEIFVATKIVGEPVESEEMLPHWFALNEIPFADMWEDDALWLPGVLAGGRVAMRFYFDDQGHLLRQESL